VVHGALISQFWASVPVPRPVSFGPCAGRCPRSGDEWQEVPVV